MTIAPPLAVTALLVSFAPIAAGAQLDADTREVLAYRLTMAKLKQLNQAMADLQGQRDADPAQQQLRKKRQELAALEQKEELSDAEVERLTRLAEEIAAAEEAEEGSDAADQSLGAMAERMAADPRVVGALQRVGLVPREAATMLLAYMQAAFTVGLLQSGAIEEIPKDANTDNVKFVQANQAELATLTAIGDQEEQ